MSLQTFYSYQFEAAKALLNILELSRDNDIKPLNVEDVDWQLGEEGPLNPFILSFEYSSDEVVKVYPKLYIGLAVDRELRYMKLLYRYAKTLGLTPLLYGRINLESDRWTKFFNIVDIGLVSVDEPSPKYEVNGLRFNVSDGKVIVSGHVDSLGILFYLLRPLSAMLGCSPYLSFPLRIETDMDLGDGFHLLDEGLKPVEDVREVFYGCVSIDGICYLEDLRLVTIPRDKS